MGPKLCHVQKLKRFVTRDCLRLTFWRSYSPPPVWPDHLFNIWSFKTKKTSPIAYKFTKVDSKFCPIKNQKTTKLTKTCQSGNISPKLVTLSPKKENAFLAKILILESENRFIIETDWRHSAVVWNEDRANSYT